MEEEIKEGEYSGDELHNLEEIVDGDQNDNYVDDTFQVRSSQGISINGTGFCRGVYTLGQIVGGVIINEEIRNNILSLDAESIRTNRHLAM